MFRQLYSAAHTDAQRRQLDAALYDLLASNGENLLKINYSKYFPKEYKVCEAMRQAALQQGQSILLRDINLDHFKPLTTTLVKEKRQKTPINDQKQ